MVEKEALLILYSPSKFEVICVQFEIVVYITNRFFLFAHNSFLEETSPEEKLGLLRTISEIIENDSVLFVSLN